MIVRGPLAVLSSILPTTTTRTSRLYASQASPSIPPQVSSAHRVYLIRHGEVIPPGGIHGVFYGAQDVELSPLGKMEAVAAGGFMADILSSNDNSNVRVFSSPLRRARYGAKKVVESICAPPEVEIIDGFKELDRGKWCGMTKEQIGEQDFENFHAAETEDIAKTVTPEGGESLYDIKRRVMAGFLDRVLANGEDRPQPRVSVIVSHLWVTRSILSESLDIPVCNFRDISIPTASVSCIDFEEGCNGKGTVVFMGVKPKKEGMEDSIDAAN